MGVFALCAVVDLIDFDIVKIAELWTSFFTDYFTIVLEYSLVDKK